MVKLSKSIGVATTAHYKSFFHHIAPWNFIAFAFVIAAKAIYCNAQLGLPHTSFLHGSNFLIFLILTFCFLIRFLLPASGLFTWLALNLLATFTIQVDLSYFRYYGELPSVGMVAQVGNIFSTGHSVSHLFHAGDAWLWTDLLLAPVLFLTKFRLFARSDRRPILVIGLAMLCLLTYKEASWSKASGISLINAISGDIYQPSFLTKYGIYHYHIRDSYQELTMYFLKRNDAEKQRLRLGYHRLVTPSQHNRYTGVFQGQNLIVLQVESMQGFALNLKIGKQEVTPNLNRIVKDNVYFSNFYHQTGPGRTSDAEFILNNSLYGLSNGYVHAKYPKNRLMPLASALKQAGYETVSMHGNYGLMYDRRRFHRSQGFAHSYFKNDFLIQDPLGMGISDKAFLGQAASLLTKSRQPFYAFLITLSSHHPFDAVGPEDHPLDLSSLPNGMMKDYLQSLHYTDEAIGSFYEALRRNGLLENTIVAILGDHNAIPWDQQRELSPYIKAPTQEIGWLLAQRVPLILHLPNGETGVNDKPGGQLDLAPTLANLLNLRASAFQGLGTDLFSDESYPVVFRDGSWIDREEAYCRESTNREEAVFALSTGKRLPLASVTAKTARAKTLLGLSDGILAFDLVPALMESAD